LYSLNSEWTTRGLNAECKRTRTESLPYR
jgi:hypothetical protein